MKLINGKKQICEKNAMSMVIGQSHVTRMNSKKLQGSNEHVLFASFLIALTNEGVQKNPKKWYFGQKWGLPTRFY